jgi:hypothetical protein
MGEKFVFAESFSNDPADKEKAVKGSEIVSSFIADTEAEKLEGEKPLPEKLERFSEKAKDWLKAYYREFGVEGQEFSKKIVMIEPREEGGLFIGGSSKVGKVLITEFPIIDEDLKFYTEAREVLHEWYHDSANYSLSMKNGSPAVERQGVNYELKHSAVEEGLTLYYISLTKFLIFTV